jgi:hypothetical protein
MAWRWVRFGRNSAQDAAFTRAVVNASGQEGLDGSEVLLFDLAWSSPQFLSFKLPLGAAGPLSV